MRYVLHGKVRPFYQTAFLRRLDLYASSYAFCPLDTPLYACKLCAKHSLSRYLAEIKDILD